MAGWEQFAINAGEQVVNQGMGLLQEALQGNRIRRKQVEQQQKFTDIQQKANLAMMAQGQEYNKDMFDYTYKTVGDKRREIEQAGMNPALLAGGAMGGGGGSASGAQGSVSGASHDEGAVQNALLRREELGLQRRMQREQIKMLEEQRKDIASQRINRDGIDRDLKEAQISNVLSDVENKKVQRAGYILDNEYKEVNNYILNMGKDLQIEQLEYLTRSSKYQLDIIMNDSEISEAVKGEVIESYRLMNENMMTDILAKKLGMKKTSAEINEIANNILMGWERISQEDSKIDISERSVVVQEEANRLREQYPSLQQVSGNLLQEFISFGWGLDRAISKGGDDWFRKIRDKGRESRK